MRLEKEAWLTLLYIAGSVSSILGTFVSIYVLLRERVLQRDITALKTEEETWHKENS